jgi:anti-sigma regulatory factor (Ser/Thr protein kinase)
MSRGEGALNTLPEVTEATVTSSDRCGWTWGLSPDPLAARHARHLVADTLGALGVPRETVGDAELMVSELVTNAYRHAGLRGPHELWLFPRGGLHRATADQGGCEVVCAVFDGLPELGLLADSTFCGDFGRGLSIVAELSGGRWGVQPARSRLHFQEPGKVVWFACPVPFTVIGRIARGYSEPCHGAI